MKERPIICSGTSVRAIQEDRKFVTRRLSKRWLRAKAGDRLWVKETWQPLRTLTPAEQAKQDCIMKRFLEGQIPTDQISAAAMSLPLGTGEPRPLYAADFGDWAYDPDSDLRPWRSSMFMPRKYSRILLECEEDARVERLQDITEEEAKMEGVESEEWVRIGGGRGTSFRLGFWSLWWTLHTKPGERWDDNPEVVRVGRFRRIA